MGAKQNKINLVKVHLLTKGALWEHVLLRIVGALYKEHFMGGGEGALNWVGHLFEGGH